MDKYNELTNKYAEVANLLCYFLEDTYLPADEINDKKTIQRFVKDATTHSLNNALSQGKEILELEEFPDYWVRTTTNRRFENPEKRKEWVKFIIDTLEQEAKLAEKL
jgi:hypothetical protein